MITPYDRPAESHVTDFYEAIPFQEIAQMSLKRDKDYSDYLNKLDAYSTNIGNIEAVSDRDKEYLRGVKDTLDKTITGAVKSGVDLGDTYQARQFLNTVQSKVDPSALKNIMGTTSNYKAYREQIEKLGKDYDPLMDESSNVSNWDSTKDRTWTGRAPAYISAEKELENIIDKVNPTMLGDYGNGYYNYGVSRDMVNKIAADNAESFATTQGGKYQVNRYRKMYGLDPKVSDVEIAQEIIKDRGEAKIGYKREGSYDLDRKLRTSALKKAQDPLNFYYSAGAQAKKNQEDPTIGKPSFSIERNSFDDKYGAKIGDGEYSADNVGNQFIIKPANIDVNDHTNYVDINKDLTKYQNTNTRIKELENKKYQKVSTRSPQGMEVGSINRGLSSNEENLLNNLRIIRDGLHGKLLKQSDVDLMDAKDIKSIKDKAQAQVLTSVDKIPNFAGGVIEIDPHNKEKAGNAQFLNTGGYAVKAKWKIPAETFEMKAKQFLKENDLYREADVDFDKLGFKKVDRVRDGKVIYDNKTGKAKQDMVIDIHLPQDESSLRNYNVNIHNLEKTLGLSVNNKQKLNLLDQSGISPDDPTGLTDLLMENLDYLEENRK